MTTDELVDEVTKAMMKVNEHTEGFTYSGLMREMAIVAVAICGKGTLIRDQPDRLVRQISAND